MEARPHDRVAERAGCSPGLVAVVSASLGRGTAGPTLAWRLNGSTRSTCAVTASAAMLGIHLDLRRGSPITTGFLRSASFRASLGLRPGARAESSPEGGCRRTRSPLQIPHACGALRACEPSHSFAHVGRSTAPAVKPGCPEEPPCVGTAHSGRLDLGTTTVLATRGGDGSVRDCVCSWGGVRSGGSETATPCCR